MSCEDRKFILSHFTGRKPVISKIYSRIGVERPQSISIVGAPGIGKSSLLEYIAHTRTKPQYLKNPDQYIYIYVSVKEDFPITFDSFAELFFHKICGAADSYIEQTPSEFSYDFIRKIVEKLHEDGKKIIIFLDDFHIITRDESFPLEFFSFLRSLANNYSLAYVTTSPADLQKVCVSKEIEESPFFNIFTTITLKPFEESESVQLLDILTDDTYALTGSDQEKICYFSGNLPNLVVLAAGILKEIKSEHQSNEVSLADNFQKKLFDKSEPFFKSLWDYFEPEEKQIFLDVVLSRKIDGSRAYILNGLTRRQFLHFVRGKFVPFSPLFTTFIETTCNLNGTNQLSGKRNLSGVISRIKNLFIPD